jgi:chromosome segregation ATPase
MPEPLLVSANDLSASAVQPPSESDHALGAEQEVARLEALLAARSRDLGALRREFERRSQLLQEALIHMPSASAGELEALRRGYEAAVDRAVEAELARAELTFTLDETRAQLVAAPASGMVSDVREQRGLYARVAQLEETEGTLHARWVLAEQDRDAARQRLRELERELALESERVDLAVARERTLAGAQNTRTAALAGECSGLRARADEAESALRSAQERVGVIERRLSDLQLRLDEARSEGAELAVAAHARAARLTELNGELALEQQAVRGARSQLTAALEAQRAERAAREADAQGWADRVTSLEAQRASAEAEVSVAAARVSELEQLLADERVAREGDANAVAARLAELEARLLQHNAAVEQARRHIESVPANWRSEWRKFLGSLEQPLVALEAALDHFEAEPARGDLAAKIKSEASEGEAANTASLLDQLRKGEEQIQQLEATLAAWRSGAARDGAIAAIKGELIDTRADAARLSDELTRERTRRRKLAVTVRALQAASESGESVAPWVEELVRIVNEGASLAPTSS